MAEERTTQLSAPSSVRIGQLSKTTTSGQTSESHERREHKISEETYIDILMNASLWNIGDDILHEYAQPHQKFSHASHIDLLLQSVQRDVDCNIHHDDENNDSLEILSHAFSKVVGLHVEAEDGMQGHARHTRSLGSVQAEAVLERRIQDDSIFYGFTGSSTLAQEADILERMWDDAMMNTTTVMNE